MLLGNIDNVHFESLIYNYEKNSHVDFTVETKTYASVLKNGSTLSDSDDISNINKSHLKRNIVMPENAIHKKKEKILFNTIQSLFKSSTLRKVVNHASVFQPLNNDENLIIQIDEKSEAPAHEKIESTSAAECQQFNLWGEFKTTLC